MFNLAVKINLEVAINALEPLSKELVVFQTAGCCEVSWVRQQLIKNHFFSFFPSFFFFFLTSSPNNLTHLPVFKIPKPWQALIYVFFECYVAGGRWGQSQGCSLVWLKCTIKSRVSKLGWKLCKNQMHNARNTIVLPCQPGCRGNNTCIIE